ncbi:uncharacterized protein LOC132551953 [Ylistrum balloti]|uniref:uncharacterized protein LOC132551953 n=1 Tax=Ylistrum balloti TaxID=509963 RepID=UPI002905EE9C|nr:uncharacterized protein LOC132551953 [Ylistrum balloti]
MELTTLTFVLLSVHVACNLAVSQNDNSVELRLNEMERNFFSAIEYLKSELRDTKGKLQHVQSELSSAKSSLRDIHLELSDTRADLQTTRVGLQKTQSELQHYRNDQPLNSSEPNALAPEPQTRREINRLLSTRSRRVTSKQEKAFSAQATGHSVSLVTHQTVMFPHVVLNEGAVYDNLTGVFTCPEPGVYYFSVTIMAFRDDEVETELVVNGYQMMINYAGGYQRHDQTTNSVVVRLNTGDRVWVRILQNPAVNTDGAIRIYGYAWSTFSGFML